jgi:hypothetical protein
LRPRSATGDTTYGTVEIIRALEDAGIRAYVPITDWDKRTCLFGREAFTYDAEADHYTCPNGAILHWDRHDYVNQTHHYHADATICNACPLKAKCTKSNEGRTIGSTARNRGRVHGVATWFAFGGRPRGFGGTHSDGGT